MPQAILNSHWPCIVTSLGSSSQFHTLQLIYMATHLLFKNFETFYYIFTFEQSSGYRHGLMSAKIFFSLEINVTKWVFVTSIETTKCTNVQSGLWHLWIAENIGSYRCWGPLCYPCPEPHFLLLFRHRYPLHSLNLLTLRLQYSLVKKRYCIWLLVLCEGISTRLGQLCATKLERSLSHLLDPRNRYHYNKPILEVPGKCGSRSN